VQRPSHKRQPSSHLLQHQDLKLRDELAEENGRKPAERWTKWVHGSGMQVELSPVLKHSART